GFVGCKERTRERLNRGLDKGDAWCFTAVERTTKVIVTWHLGKRTPNDTRLFAEKLRVATAGRFQLSTDGYKPYRRAIQNEFGQSIDFAQLIKVFGNTPERGPESRYSPGQVIDTYPVIWIGLPDPDKICTSHAERANRSIRMAVRRMTRLT